MLLLVSTILAGRRRRLHGSKRCLVAAALIPASLVLTACGTSGSSQAASASGSVHTTGTGGGGNDSGRSVAAFCQTYSQQKTSFLSRYARLAHPIPSNDPHAGADVLADALLSVQSLGDVTVILTKLDAVAPADIEPDMSAVLASWRQTQSNLGDEASNAFDPKAELGAMFKGIFEAAESNGSWTRVGDYVTKNCGPSA